MLTVAGVAVGAIVSAAVVGAAVSSGRDRTVYVEREPVYVQQQPVYYAPPPVYYQRPATTIAGARLQAPVITTARHAVVGNGTKNPPLQAGFLMGVRMTWRARAMLRTPVVINDYY